MRLYLCGVRGSTSAPGADFLRYGGHTSCVALAHDDARPSLVLDAGTGLRRVTPLLGGTLFEYAFLHGKAAPAVALVILAGVAVAVARLRGHRRHPYAETGLVLAVVLAASAVCALWA